MQTRSQPIMWEDRSDNIAEWGSRDVVPQKFKNCFFLHSIGTFGLYMKNKDDTIILDYIRYYMILIISYHIILGILY